MIDAPVTEGQGSRRSPAKTAAILDGAMGEFLAHGYAATSMDRIAQAARVSKATVYGHFQDKEALFQALAQQLVDQRFSLLFGTTQDGSAAEPLPSDPRQALQELARRLLAMDRSQPDFLSFLRLVIGESGRFPQLGQIFVDRIHQTAFQQVAQLFANLERLPASGPDGNNQSEQQPGEPPGPETRARVFIGALAHLVIVQDVLHGKSVVPVDRDHFAVDLVTMLCP